MLNKKRVITGSVIALCLCIAVIFAVKNINKKESAPVVDIDKEEKVEEEKKEEVVVPPIVPDEEEQGQKEETVKEEVKNIDGEKVLTKSAPKPKEKNLPDAVQKPEKKEKPTAPPTPPVKDTTKDTTTEEHPEYSKEEKPQVVKGGTGEDGVLRDTKGNPIDWPTATPNEVKSSDLLEPGDPQGEMGQGDKF